MTKTVHLINSAVYAVPVFDETGAPVKQEVLYRGRTVKVDAVDNVFAHGGRNHDVPDEVAKEWIALGIAREVDPIIDGDFGV